MSGREVFPPLPRWCDLVIVGCAMQRIVERAVHGAVLGMATGPSTSCLTTSNDSAIPSRLLAHHTRLLGSHREKQCVELLTCCRRPSLPAYVSDVVGSNTSSGWWPAQGVGVGLPVRVPPQGSPARHGILCRRLKTTLRSRCRSRRSQDHGHTVCDAEKPEGRRPCRATGLPRHVRGIDDDLGFLTISSSRSSLPAHRFGSQREEERT